MGSVVIPAIKRPFINKIQSIALANRLFGLRVQHENRVKELDSYQDRNFYLQGTITSQEKSQEQNQLASQEFTLKITNHTDSSKRGTIDAQSSAMLFLKKHGISCPVPVQSIFGIPKLMCKVPQRESKAGKMSSSGGVQAEMSSLDNLSLIEGIELFDGGEYNPDEHFICAVRLLTFVPGKLFLDVPQTEGFLFNFGRTLGRLNQTLKGFHHPNLDGLQHKWDLAHMPAVENFIEVIPEEHKKGIVSLVCRQFEEEVLAKLDNFEKQVIHGDVNTHNTLVTWPQPESLVTCPQPESGGYNFAFIDFGDLVISYRLFEVAIAMMYIINMGERVTPECIHHAGQVLAGYHSVYPLSDEEVDLLYVSIAARFCQVLVFGAYSYKYFDPGNEYLLRSAKKGWGNLQGFLDSPTEEILRIWRQELGRAVIQREQKH